MNVYNKYVEKAYRYNLFLYKLNYNLQIDKHTSTGQHVIYSILANDNSFFINNYKFRSMYSLQSSTNASSHIYYCNVRKSADTGFNRLFKIFLWILVV